MSEGISETGRILFIMAMFVSGCIMGGMLQRLRMIKRMKQCEKDMLAAQREENKHRKSAHSWESMAKTMEYKASSLIAYAEQMEAELNSAEEDLAVERLSNRIVWPRMAKFERN